MSEIDMRFSSLGLLTYQFEAKFKKVLLFLETMQDPELLFNITCFLDIDDLLSLLSTCKKLNSLKNCPIIEVRILKHKIRFLQSPKQAFNSLNLLPAYYQFLLHHKQEDIQIQKNAEKFFKNVKQFKKARQMINKGKKIAIKSKSSEVVKILQADKLYDNMITQTQKNILSDEKIYQPIWLAKEPFNKDAKPKSYVEKFREDYAKLKEFERKKNIKELQSLHKKESEKIKIKGQIETPFKKIPIIEIKEDERISVINADQFYITKGSRFLHQVKTILGLNVYY